MCAKIRVGGAWLAIWFTAPSLVAQEMSPPKAPFVVVPQAARWDVVMRPHSGPQDVSSKPEVRVESTLFGDVKRDVFIVSGKKPREIWYRDGVLLLPTDNEGYAVAVDPKAEDSGIGANIFYALGFPGVSWIDAKSFRGYVEKSGTKCLFFEKMGATPSRAWIDETTRRPVIVEIGESVLQFSYQEPPRSPLNMPAAYAEAWKRCRALVERRKAIENAGR